MLNNNECLMSSSLRLSLKSDDTKLKLEKIKKCFKHEAMASRYANALFDLALELNIVETIRKDLFTIFDTLVLNESVYSIFNQEVIEKKNQIKILSDTYKNIINEKTFNLILVLIEKSRFCFIPSIILEFEKSIYKYYNIANVLVTTAYEIENMEFFEASIEKAIKRDVVITKVLDESLICGFIVSIDDKVYDYSMKNELKKIKEDILNCDLKEAVIIDNSVFIF